MRLGKFAVPSHVVAVAACHALMSFDGRLASSSARNRHLIDINFINIKYDITRCMIDVFKSTLQLPVSSRQWFLYEKHQFLLTIIVK